MTDLGFKANVLCANVSVVESSDSTLPMSIVVLYWATNRSKLINAAACI